MTDMAQLHADHMPSPTVRVGVDLVRVSEVAASLARFGDRYACRLFTASERGYCCVGDGRTAERLAARFAAKEATLKVLRPTPQDGIDWRSIEVRQTADGVCEIVLHGTALALARRNGISGLSVSMSHEGDYATATVVSAVGTAPNADAPPRAHTAQATTRPRVRRFQTSWDA